MTTRKSKRATPVLADATAATNNNGKETKDEDNNNGKESLSENVNPSKDKDNDNKKVATVNEDTDSPIHPTACQTSIEVGGTGFWMYEAVAESKSLVVAAFSLGGMKSDGCMFLCFKEW